MINISDKKMLESTFADNFGSPYYPILAEMYLNEGNLSRARKVCEIGLDHDSSNVDGKFIFAKVAIAEKKFIMAEKLLKKVVDESPAHFNALRMLIRVEVQLSRSPKTINNYINKLLLFLPQDAECLEWLNNIQSSETVGPLTSSSVPDKIKLENNIPIQSTDSKNNYKIEQSMATLTMAQVLQSQQHYQEALAVLDMLESKGLESKQIAIKREEILELISAPRK